MGEAPDVEDALFFDADGDGVLDVISSTEGETRRIFVHWAPRGISEFLDYAKWNTETLYADGSRWMFAVPIKFGQRQIPDLVVGGKDRGAKISSIIGQDPFCMSGGSRRKNAEGATPPSVTPAKTRDRRTTCIDEIS